MQAKLDKLGAVLAQTSTSTQDAGLFAAMLSLPNDGRYPALDLEPQQRRQKTLQALSAQMEALSRQKPVLMIFEDAYWTDPTSLETFGRVVDRVQTLPVLLIVTFRPEFEPPWIGRPYVMALTINRLAQRDVEAMIDRVVGDEFVPASIRQGIIERTDGIPLFVEEMTKAVLEATSEGAAQNVASIPSAKVAVPVSLQASLMARLDRLGSGKEVAQIGAAIGREFSHAFMSAIVTKPERELASALERLIATGLLFRQGQPPHANYLFKHALVREAAYGTLLREPRRALHARIAGILENQFTEIAEKHPEVLAHHCSEARLIEKAVGLWGKAGGRFLDRSALIEAMEHLKRALDQIAMLSPTPGLRRREIKLQAALLNPLAHVKGYSAPETKAAAERARVLIEQAEAQGEPPKDPMLLFQVLNIIWAASFSAFNGDVVRELATQFLELAEKQGAALPRMIGHRLMGVSLAWTGEIAQGRTHVDQSVALYDPADRTLAATRLSAHASLSVRSLILWLLGYPKAALADAHQALDEARRIDLATTLIEALDWTSHLEALCGNHSAGNARVSELLALAEEKSLPRSKRFGMSVQGLLHALTGEPSDAVRALTSGLARKRSTGETGAAP
jgi:predicted ATPase